MRSDIKERTTASSEGAASLIMSQVLSHQQLRFFLWYNVRILWHVVCLKASRIKVWNVSVMMFVLWRPAQFTEEIHGGLCWPSCQWRLGLHRNLQNWSRQLIKLHYTNNIFVPCVSGSLFNLKIILLPVLQLHFKTDNNFPACFNSFFIGNGM